MIQATSWLPAARTPGARLQVLSRLWATHLSEILLKMPELQTLFEFLLMLCPKLIKGSLSFIQLGQEPRKEEGTCAVLEGPVGEGRIAPCNVKQGWRAQPPSSLLNTLASS